MSIQPVLSSKPLPTVKMGSTTLVFLIAVVFIYLLSGARAIQLKQKPLAEYISYTSVPGYFLQDSNATNASTFNFVSPPSRTSPIFRV